MLTVVTSELQPPYPDRPTEGFLTLNVEYSPMAALGIDVSACVSCGVGGGWCGVVVVGYTYPPPPTTTPTPKK